MKKNMNKMPAILVALIMIASALMVLHITPNVTADYAASKTPATFQLPAGLTSYVITSRYLPGT